MYICIYNTGTSKSGMELLKSGIDRYFCSGHLVFYIGILGFPGTEVFFGKMTKNTSGVHEVNKKGSRTSKVF